MIVSKTTTVEKSALDAGDLLGGILTGVLAKKPVGDIASGELTDLMNVFGDAAGVPSDWQENPAAFIRGLTMGLTEKLESSLLKPAAPSAPAPTEAAAPAPAAQ